MSARTGILHHRVVAPPKPDPWQSSLNMVIMQLRRRSWVAVAVPILGAVAGAFIAFFVPATHKAMAQLFIDPRGLRVFSNDLSSGVFDANAAINFVESQIGIMKSERVLMHVVREVMIP